MSESIRMAERHDIEGMSVLVSGLFAIESDFCIDEEKHKRALGFLLDDPDAAVFVMEDDAVITGMITGQKIVSTASGGFSVLIEDLFVVPRRRRRGTGKALLMHLVEWAKREKGALRVQLVADHTNAPALKFYEKAGFERSRMTGLYKKIDV